MVKVVDETPEIVARMWKASRLSTIAREVFTGDGAKVNLTGVTQAVAIFPEGRKMSDLRTCGAYVLISTKIDEIMIFNPHYEGQSLELAQRLEKEFGVEYTLKKDYSYSVTSSP